MARHLRKEKRVIIVYLTSKFKVHMIKEKVHQKKQQQQQRNNNTKPKENGNVQQIGQQVHLQLIYKRMNKLNENEQICI